MSLHCPTCDHLMIDGWVAMWNPLIGQKVRWQEPKPGYGRLRVPEGAKVLLKARVGGKDARPASRCSSCATVVIPPEQSYDS